MNSDDQPRILVAEADLRVSRSLSSFLNERGFRCKTAEKGSVAIKSIENWQPQFVIYDMMLPELNALEFLTRCSKGMVGLPKGAAIMIISSHNAPENVNACLHAGASDFIKKPFTNQDILARLAFQMQKRNTVKKVSSNDISKRGEYFLYLTELMLKKSTTDFKETEDVLFDLLSMQAMALKAVRCSLIKTNQKNLTGTVLRSSDDKNFSGFCISLEKYPEVTSVLQSQKLIAIDDLSANKVMAEIKNDLKSISFNSMVVCPVFSHQEIFGVISTRRKEDAPVLTDADLRFSQVLAHVCGLILQADNPYADDLSVAS